MHPLQKALDTMSQCIADADTLETSVLAAKRALQSHGGKAKVVNEVDVALTYFALARKRLIDARVIAELGQQTFNFKPKG